MSCMIYILNVSVNLPQLQMFNLSFTLCIRPNWQLWFNISCSSFLTQCLRIRLNTTIVVAFNNSRTVDFLWMVKISGNYQWSLIEIYSLYHRSHVGKIQNWLKTKRNKARLTKLTHMTITLWIGSFWSAHMNNKEINKHIGLHLHSCLTWHKKYSQKKICWSTGEKSQLTVENILFLSCIS